jgi:hypothetical protein
MSTGARAVGSSPSAPAARALLVLGIALLLAPCIRAQADTELERLGERVDALSSQVDNLAASGGTQPGRAVHVGGYAEMHYNAPEDGPAELDFHRFVLAVSKPINDWIYFNSEVEIEHGLVEGGKETGELELEQAWLQFQLAPWIGVRAGIVLAPVGIINSRHEPPSFYGVERPDFDRVIVPTTWFDHGAGVVGELGNLSFEAYAISPLDASGFSGAEGIREGRQEANHSDTGSAAFTGMVRYRSAGFALGASFFTGDALTQDVRDCARLSSGESDEGEGEEEGGATESCPNTKKVGIGSVPVNLIALDFEWQQDIFALRAEMAMGTIGNSEKLNEIYGKDVGSAFNGAYVEPSLRVWRSGDQAIGLFVRYEDLNPQAKVAKGKVNDSFNFTKSVGGANYWPSPDVVLKADVERKAPKSGEAENGFNLGIGWVF